MATDFYADAPLKSAGGLVSRRIVRVNPVGKRRMYDIEVSNPKHNFCLPNGVITSNSHSACYAVLAYACAFLKQYYPLEWWCAVLNNASKEEIATKFWRYCKDFVLLPDIQKSTDKFYIVGDKIRAPITLIAGVAEAAMNEIKASLPYKDIKDFCEKIAKTKDDKKTIKEDGKVKSGRSALNSGVVNKLIVSGIIDSLFPPGLDQLSKLELFQRELATALNRRKPVKVDPFYVSANSAANYQLKKSILPVYTDFLAPKLHDLKIDGVVKKEVDIGGERAIMYSYLPTDIETGKFILKSADVRHLSSTAIVDGKMLKVMSEDAIIDRRNPLRIAVAAYVIEHRQFKYSGGNAAALVLDVDGEIVDSVKWPNRKTKELFMPEGDLTGSICIVLMNKWDRDRPFSIDAVIKVCPALEG